MRDTERMKIRKTSQDLLCDELRRLDGKTVKVIPAEDIGERHAHNLEDEADVVVGA